MDIIQKRLLVKAARLYYEQDLTQAEISKILRISRQKVQRLLRQARDEEIVHITIHPIVGTFSDLERSLEKRFALADALVVDTTAHGDQVTVAKEVGAGAADYLVRMVRPNDKIVLSWGNSLLGMVNALSSKVRDSVSGLQVIQGLGGLGDPNHEIHATELVRRAAKQLGAQVALLPAPAVAATIAARDAYCNDTYVARAIALARTADIAFVGIGSSSAESILVPEFWHVMTSGALQDLTLRGAIGSINLRYFDENGSPIASELDSRVIGLTLEELKKVYRVVGIAGGAAKLKAIRAALRARLINVLVTDHITAQDLLKTDKDTVEVGPIRHEHSTPAEGGVRP